MSNHVSLLADLDAGIPCTGEAAAAIRDLEARIEELQQELRRCRVFITTREKMHPDGVALFDEALGDAEETEAQRNRQLDRLTEWWAV